MFIINSSSLSNKITRVLFLDLGVLLLDPAVEVRRRRDFDFGVDDDLLMLGGSKASG